jgi:glycosyltransferase involved in cell wall biosynthesis
VLPNQKEWAIATSGFSWLTESVRECALAVQAVGGRVLHVGPEMDRPWVDCVQDVSDLELAAYYRGSAYVSGLRRIEGFELPAAEGLVCGARPICFYKAHYKDWYGDWAEYVDEGPRPMVQDELTRLLSGPYRHVTDAERQAACARFDWAKLVPTFYGRMVSTGHSSSLRVRHQQRERVRLPQGRRA